MVIEKYSAEPKAVATATSGGAKAIIRTIEKQPPMKLAKVVIASATPARPCLAIG